MATRICIDVDLTLVDANEDLLPGALEGLKLLKDKGYELTLWSYGGEERARAIARKHNLGCFFDGYATKPDFVIDDDAEAVSRLPVVDAIGTTAAPRDWARIGRFAVQLAENLDNRTTWRQVPARIRALAGNEFDVAVHCAVSIWNQRDTYIRWPRTQRLLLPNVTKHRDGDDYDYPPEVVAEANEAGWPVDQRSNGPAILAFQLAGGDRPRRPFPENWSWTIHHIYDGQFALADDQIVPHAIHDGNLFTESAGLVAVHPLADYVAMSSPLLAWLLRWEAFRRFGFDPMKVFQGAS